MVKKNDLKRVVEHLLRWGEDLQYPMKPSVLENIWQKHLQESLDKFNIPQPLSDKDFARIRNSTIDFFVDSNLDSIKTMLEQQILTDAEIYAASLDSAKTTAEFLNLLNLHVESSINKLTEQHFYYMESSESKIDMQALRDSLDDRMIEMSKITKPSFYITMDSKITSYIRSSFQRIQPSIPTTLTLTCKEQYQGISGLIESENFNLLNYSLREYQYFPEVLIRLYKNQLKNLITEEWMKSREAELQSLERNFLIFLETILDKIAKKELEAFDGTLCNQQCRISLAEIIVGAFPESLVLPCLVLDNILNLLKVPNPGLYLENLSLKESISFSVSQFLASTDQISRFFSIICIVLVISDTYECLHNENITTTRRYDPLYREWIRQIVYTAFQREYEAVLGIHPQCSEWSLVLITEKFIINRIPGWIISADIIDMTSYIQEKYAKEAKGLGDKLSDFSEGLSNGNFFKRSMQIASKVVKGISPSRHIKEFALELIKNEPSLHITICVSGWLSQEDEMENAWLNLVGYHQQGSTFALRWEAGSAKKLVKKELFSSVYHVAGLILATPILKIAHLAMIFASNPFKKRARKAEITGYVLADLIMSMKLGNACVSLIGFSLGTRVIYFCLQRLQKMNYCVHDVILLGGAAPCDLKTWRLCRKAVTGRLINTYCKTDKILSRLYALSKLEKAIGNWPIDVQGIENYDITEIATGHLMYREVLHLVLQRVAYNSK